ncbi:hypothetical protein XELAEV_18009886mg [Xenopus laevis]|uniref:Uncharacterized protein n=1 Tax=Xenopus laevis TaxID=8355 RepID=A0A974DVA8_XENLA|nr:hypothetical protein XELAEV_18009886mg [Xenopus laevis]
MAQRQQKQTEASNQSTPRFKTGPVLLQQQPCQEIYVYQLNKHSWLSFRTSSTTLLLLLLSNKYVFI